MTEALFWLFVFFALYSVYCIFWGATSARTTRTAGDFFLADRQVPSWVFVVAATVMSFTGWAAIGLPAIVLRDGFAGASLAMCAITIPLAGVLFLKRQWMLSRRFGYVTSAELFSDYFGGQLMRLIVMLIALLFALPFLGMQLTAAGYLIQVVSNAAIPWVFSMWIFTALVFLYVCLGGMGAVAYVGVLQGLLFAVGCVAIAVFAWARIDGFGSFVALLAELDAGSFGPWGASTAGYNAYLRSLVSYKLWALAARRRSAASECLFGFHLLLWAYGPAIGACVTPSGPSLPTTPVALLRSRSGRLERLSVLSLCSLVCFRVSERSF